MSAIRVLAVTAVLALAGCDYHVELPPGSVCVKGHIWVPAKDGTAATILIHGFDPVDCVEIPRPPASAAALAERKE